MRVVIRGRGRGLTLGNISSSTETSFPEAICTEECGNVITSFIQTAPDCRVPKILMERSEVQTMVGNRVWRTSELLPHTVHKPFDSRVFQKKEKEQKKKKEPPFLPGTHTHSQSLQQTFYSRVNVHVQIWRRPEPTWNAKCCTAAPLVIILWIEPLAPLPTRHVSH